LVLFSMVSLHSQEVYTDRFDSIASQCREELMLFADRSVYAVNEPVRFSAFLLNRPSPYHAPESRVLYVELVSASGDPVARGKFPVDEGRSGGQLVVPGSALTGNYFLVGYTKWMRNFSTSQFTYLPVKILNPFSNRVENGTIGETDRSLIPDQPGKEPVHAGIRMKSFSKGDSMQVTAELAGNAGNSYVTGCVTAVPSGSIDSSAFRYRVEPAAGQEEVFRFMHLPDTDGMVITGRITTEGTEEALPGTWIHFSSPGTDPAYVVAQSNQAGRFAVRLPERQGIREMIVVPEPQGNPKPEIRLDNDFNTEELPVDPEPFSLSENERELGSRIALNMQLRQAYYAGEPGITEFVPDPDTVPFYGKTGTSVTLEEFIDLPNLEEVIENLIPGVFVTRTEGAPALQISGKNTMISLYKPLVLVDQVPVFDAGKVLSIQPSQIARIDVVHEVYLLGEARFGGLLILNSIRGNMAGISPSEHAYFFDYMNFSEPGLKDPELNPGNRANPDVRNTLFWEEKADLYPGHPFLATFKTPENPGSYFVWYRGMTASGTRVEGRLHFTVD